MKLSEFKIIRHENQIKDTDYMVIVCVSRMSAEYLNWEVNIVEYKGEKYVFSFMKGMYKNFIRTSKDLNTDQTLRKKFPGYELFLGGIMRGNHLEFFAYKNWQHLIEDNLVLVNDFKAPFEIDHETMIWAIENNEKFYSPSNN